MTISTWDPAKKGTNTVLSGGNLISTHANDSGWSMTLSTSSHSANKFYAEIVATTIPASHGDLFQIGFAQNDQTLNGYIGQGGNDGWVRADMSGSDGGAEGIVSFATANRGYTTLSDGDVVGIAFDFDAGKAWIAKNNSFGGSPSAGTNPAFTWAAAGSWFLAVASYVPTYTAVATIHTDSSNQTYSPPSGFVAWDGVAGGAPSVYNKIKRNWLKRRGISG